MGNKQKEHKPFFYNVHTHTFNFNHVHAKFLKGIIPLHPIVTLMLLFLVAVWLWVLNSCYTSIVWLCTIISIVLAVFIILNGLVIYIAIFQPKINRLLRSTIVLTLIKYMAKISAKKYDSIARFINLILHSYDPKAGKMKSQREIFNRLQSYYPSTTKFVVLSMDMDYMVNCNKPKNHNYGEQLVDLEEMKEQKKYADIIYPFVHTDPRRVKDDQNFNQSGKPFIEIMKKYLLDKTFSGIKIYPALGYFPFDLRLKPVYDFALEYDIPITTHCSIGPVYYRGKLKTLRNEGYYNHKSNAFIHPFTGNVLEGKNGKEFSPHFTHPLNYYCLMNEPELLAQYWNKCERSFNNNIAAEYNAEELRKYRKLKINLAHFGGGESWKKYLDDPWLPERATSLTINKSLMHRKNGDWVHEHVGVNIKDLNAHSWHCIISDMIGLKDKTTGKSVFPNLYSDIAYNLSDKELLPLLKVRLETNADFALKTMFGTDFFMVSTQASEREITMNIRSYIGEQNFETIAVKNPQKFLSTKHIN